MPEGKQPASVARPVGVGVLVEVEKVLCPENKSLSKPPKMNHLFFMIGPPTVPPLNSSLLRRGPLSGLHCGVDVGQVTVPGSPLFVPGLLACRWVLVRAFRKLLYSVPNTAPCHAFPPPLVMTLTTEPALRPYSGPKLFETITYCSTKFVSLTNSPGPPTLLSLLFCPSSSWSLLRPRRPLLENPPPLVLEKLSLREATTPGTKRARRSGPWFS